MNTNIQTANELLKLSVVDVVSSVLSRKYPSANLAHIRAVLSSELEPVSFLEQIQEWVESCEKKYPELFQLLDE
jgi:hypothetical protein